jgi:hypothetical protein
LEHASDGEFDARIPDDSGKELDTLNDAHLHARKLIEKITFHVGHDGTGCLQRTVGTWTVLLSSIQDLTWLTS